MPGAWKIPEPAADRESNRAAGRAGQGPEAHTPAFIRESVGYIENLSTEDRFRERHGGDRLDSGAIIVIASPGNIQGVFWSQTARRSLYRLAATSPTDLEEETGRHVAVAHDRRFEEPANDVRRFLESGRTSNLVDF